MYMSEKQQSLVSNLLLANAIPWPSAKRIESFLVVMGELLVIKPALWNELVRSREVSIDMPGSPLRYRDRRIGWDQLAGNDSWLRGSSCHAEWCWCTDAKTFL